MPLKYPTTGMISDPSGDTEAGTICTESCSAR